MKALARPCNVPGKELSEALDKAERLVADGGFGHTSSVYLNAVTEQEKLNEFSNRMKTGRVLVNTPSSHGGIGDLYNFRLAPSSHSAAVPGRKLRIRQRGSKAPHQYQDRGRKEKTCFGSGLLKVYIKKGCLPVALDELKNVMGKKKAIVTDSFLYKNGYTKPVTDKLDEMGIMHTTFFEWNPIPHLKAPKGGGCNDPFELIA